MVEIAIGRRCQLQCPEADVIEGLIVNAEGVVGVLHQLMDGQGGVVRLHNGVRHLRKYVFFFLEFILCILFKFKTIVQCLSRFHQNTMLILIFTCGDCFLQVKKCRKRLIFS